MTDVEFTDEMFEPANPRVADAGSNLRSTADLAEVSGHNDQLPVAKPMLGAGPTQAREDRGWDEIDHPTVVKPPLESDSNYPAGIGGFAMRPNTGDLERVSRNPETGEIEPSMPYEPELEGIEGPEDLEE